MAGSHSMGGTSTASPLRIPRIRFSVSAVMKAPTTGPKDRLYGKVIVLSTKLVNDSSSGYPPSAPNAPLLLAALTPPVRSGGVDGVRRSRRSGCTSS